MTALLQAKKNKYDLLLIFIFLIFTGCNKPPNFDPDNRGEAKALKNWEEWSAVGRIGFNYYNTDFKDTITIYWSKYNNAGYKRDHFTFRPLKYAKWK